MVMMGVYGRVRVLSKFLVVQSDGTDFQSWSLEFLARFKAPCSQIKSMLINSASEDDDCSVVILGLVGTRLFAAEVMIGAYRVPEPKLLTNECTSLDIHCDFLVITTHSHSAVFIPLQNLNNGFDGITFNVSNH
jgi:hypothetical protein